MACENPSRGARQAWGGPLRGMPHPAQAPTPSTLALQALDHIAAASDPTASHNCWAFRVAGNARSNDDGEPSGTGEGGCLLLKPT